MAVYKDTKRNTWYCVIRYTDDTGTPKSKMKRGFVYKKLAQEYEQEFRKNINQFDSAIVPTFSEVFYKYLETIQHNIRPKTKQSYINVFNKCLKDLEKKKINKITQLNIDNVLTQIKNSAYSTSSKNHAIRLFKAILQYSNDVFDTTIKLHSLKRVKKSIKEVKPLQVWSDTEFNAFIQCVDNPVYASFFQFLYMTGARRGEAIALTWNDIKNDRVTINKSQISYKQGSQSTKTFSSIRTVLLDLDTLERLKSVENGNYVFGGDKPLSPTHIQRHFDKAISLSKVKKIRIHDLRHSHATNLINKGANIVAVSKRLGHSNISMTLEVYTHLLEDTERELLNYL